MSELLKTKGSRSSPISSIVTPSQTSTHNPAKKKRGKTLAEPFGRSHSFLAEAGRRGEGRGRCGREETRGGGNQRDLGCPAARWGGDVL